MKSLKSSENLLPNLRWASRFVWKSGPILTVSNVVISVLESLIPLITLYLTKLVFDGVASGINQPDKVAVFTDVGYTILLLAVLVLIERVLGILGNLASAAQSHVVTDRMYEMLHSKSMAIDLEYYENSEYYDTLHRAQQDAPYRPTRIFNGLFSFGQSVLSLLAIGALLFTFHWSVPALLIVAAIPGMLVRFRFAARLYIWTRVRTPTERQALYFNEILTEGEHAKELRLFNLGPMIADRFKGLRDQIRQERLRLLSKRSAAELITQSGAVVPLFGLYGFLAYRAIHGYMTIGDLVMFYQAVQRGQSYLNRCMASIAELYENNLFLSNVHEFLALKPKLTEPSSPRIQPEHLRDAIVFQNVKFRYPDSERIVLDDINLRIRAGEHIALVGENGSGKTTLVKLLSRLYDPTNGAITFDGSDLRDISLAVLRKKISVVFQDYARFHLTAKENIWFGNVEIPLELQRVVAAARQAGADEPIGKLKYGYDTVLGKRFENGEELSIGEWQKIALARAFLRDAEIIILDEPTSALDAKAEYEVFKKFHQLSKGKTAVLISHRLSTVKMADRICFLEGGRIVESGSHDELIDHGGKYADMFERQAQNYR